MIKPRIEMCLVVENPKKPGVEMKIGLASCPDSKERRDETSQGQLQFNVETVPYGLFAKKALFLSEN